VFFDGHPPGGEFAASQVRGVRVVFSLHREADDAIVDAVRDADQAGQVLVVTDDLDLARRAAQLGAKSTRVRTFFAAAPTDAREGDEKPSGAGSAHAADAGGLTDDEIARMERAHVSGERRTPGAPPRRRPRRSPRPR
jgi:hypothetical protein